MRISFTLEYWTTDGKVFGRLREIPPISARGATLEELEKKIRVAYLEMLEDQTVSLGQGTKLKEINIDF